MTRPFTDLLIRAQNGDSAAIEDLLAPHLAGLTAFVRLQISGRVRLRASTADVVQSICLEVLKGLSGIEARDQSGFKSWLFAVARRKMTRILNRHEAGRRDIRRECHPGLDSRVDDDALLAQYRMLTPSREASAREEIRRIEEAFARLPRHYRDVILLVGFAGLGYRAAGRQMGRTEDSVRQLLHRARARLATLLD